MSSSRALASQEREMQFVRFGRTAKALLLLIATLMTFATVVLIVTDRLYRPDAFVINQLKLKGSFNYVTPRSVQDVVYAEPLGNFFSIELAQIKQRVEQMPWVKHVDVRREWPHTLIVAVSEHRPVLRWESTELSGTDNAGIVERWISAGGKVIGLEKPLAKKSAMLLKGSEHDAKEMLANAMKWQRQLAPSGVRIASMALSPSQSWSLKLKHLNQEGEFELLLGRTEVEARLRRFQALFDQQFKQANVELVRVDARYPDGVAIQAEERKAEDVNNASSEMSKFEFDHKDQPS